MTNEIKGFKVEENLDFLEPMIHLSHTDRYEDKDIYINKENIEIEITSDYGYGECFSSYIYLPIDKLEELIAKVKNAKKE